MKVASPVLNGGDEEPDNEHNNLKELRLVPTQRVLEPRGDDLTRHV